MAQDIFKNEINQIRRGILFDLLKFNGDSLEFYSEEIQEIFEDSALEVLKDNEGTQGQYKNLIKTYYRLKSVIDCYCKNMPNKPF